MDLQNSLNKDEVILIDWDKDWVIEDDRIYMLVGRTTTWYTGAQLLDMIEYRRERRDTVERFLLWGK